jgi:hypothetical protein
MSLKKELLDRLSEDQLRDLAESKGIKFKLKKVRKQYYQDWDERDKLVDMMSSKPELTIKDIEEYIKNMN